MKPIQEPPVAGTIVYSDLDDPYSIASLTEVDTSAVVVTTRNGESLVIYLNDHGTEDGSFRGMKWGDRTWFSSQSGAIISALERMRASLSEESALLARLESELAAATPPTSPQPPA